MAQLAASFRPFSLGCLAIFVIWATLVVTPGRVRADGQDVHIREVMAGANGASSAQFLVIEQTASGQNLWGPQGSETQSRAMLVFYDATGRETGIYKFPANPSTGGSLQTLVATAEFAALLGAPAPDLVIPALLQPMSGKVCFTSNPLNPTTTFRDCLSYGSFTGDVGTNIRSGASIAAGTPAATLPITDTVSLKRASDSGRNADFTLNATPTPKNIAGATVTIGVDSQILQGERLFKQETFGGNGRTCATCHVPAQSFGLQPAGVQSRFATLSTTYDSLFLAETTQSGVTTSLGASSTFDYNLNTLTLTAAVATGAPCTGELRGIITTASTGGRAKVLARTSATTYLVGGGISPALAGAATDGTCAATVASVAAGTLGANASSAVPGLEDPRLMRTSRSDNLTDGRALILENVDQITLDNVTLAVDPRVFRRSPPLLNMRFTAPFGWSGDIPDLRTFSTGAVKQHLTRTLVRTSGGAAPDFRLPTSAELAALEAFQLAQDFPSGTDPDKYDLSRFATSAAAQRGRTAFFGNVAKCSQCHGGSVLGQMTVPLLGEAIGTNGRFDTGVVNQVFSGGTNRDNLPCEPSLSSLGACGSRRFSTPQLFNVKHLTPLFHDGSAFEVNTAVVFYNSPAFNNSPAGVAIGGIHMPAPANNCQPAGSPCTMITDIVAFLESLVTRSLTSNSSLTASGAGGSAVSPVPSVIVRDDSGTPVSGVTVTFAVASGGGSVSGASAVSNASGVATVGGWVLGAGVNTLTANLEGASGSPVTFSAFGVTVPTMSIDKPSLAFGAIGTGTGFSAQTATQTVRLTQSGTGGVTWTAASTVPWLTVSPASGSGSATLSVSTQFVTNLAASQGGAVTLTFTGAGNTIAPIAVTLRVSSAGASAAPFGSLDTPLDNTGGVTGSLAVTGWALDDVQVTRVRIVREAVTGEAAGSQIYLGDAAFVDGARSDVAAVNPTAPLNTRGGWGYLLLTNFLPGLGNGAFRLSAYADDADGRTTLLGSRTIVCTNSAATTPFGAIDTPGQGQSVSGVVTNFGWVLSAGTRRADPLHGGAVSVVIDGAIVGAPTGWVDRADLTALFPAAQFSGIANALGVYTFDTTTLANGVHTISWVVADDQGAAAGVGSRYFTVSNGTSQTLAPAGSSSSASGVIDARRGPDTSAPFATLAPDAGGARILQAEELDRIELRVHARGGRLQTPLGDRPLPIGTRIDPADGTFTWQPGPGFVGPYDLVFDTPRGPRQVRVVLNPQGSLTRPRVVVDLPTAGAEIGASFTVAGWALDPQAAQGTGISAVHVWAYPTHTGAPIFLGAATLGGERPDVAQVHGAPFTRSGFGLVTSGLPLGTYDLAVFAWSDARGAFLPAAVTRVVVR